MNSDTLELPSPAIDYCISLLFFLLFSFLFLHFQPLFPFLLPPDMCRQVCGPGKQERCRAFLVANTQGIRPIELPISL